ncbi:MAG: VIT1/CCC1 transporter family protein [Acidithiobacillus sp.]
MRLCSARCCRTQAIRISAGYEPVCSGANGGLLSTASLLTGVAGGRASHEQILLAGAAALVAGAFVMAAGE